MDRPATAIRRPNILFLLTDDQRADAVHALGNRVIQTPNLDRLAASGLVLTNAYCMGSDMSAVCFPSRSMLLSGLSLFHLKHKKGGYAVRYEINLPKTLRAGGLRNVSPRQATKRADRHLSRLRARKVSRRRHGRAALGSARQGNRRRGRDISQDARPHAAVFRLSGVRQPARSARRDSGIPQPVSGIEYSPAGQLSAAASFRQRLDDHAATSGWPPGRAPRPRSASI